MSDDRGVERYGLVFPEGTPPATIELWCYAHDHTIEKGGLGKAAHMLNAIQYLWPERMPNGEKGFIISDWTERRIDAWCNPTFRPGDEDFQSWWGPSSAGKSCDAGVIILVDWLSDPFHTSTAICSTTRDMLEQRIWGDIVKYYQMWQGKLPGVHRSAKMRITMGDEYPKACLRGIAVLQGNISDAMANIVGVHNDNNRLVVDECQSSKMRVAIDACDNLSTGKSFKFLAMGNPESRLDPLGEISEPKEGWESISDQSGQWETGQGKTLHFDGLKSPAIKEPEKYYFLLNQKQIDDLGTKKGYDSPAFWSQRRGYIPPEGLTRTVMTESFIVNNKVRNSIEWESDYITVAGIDPAYSTGGDNCVFYPAQVGKSIEGINTVKLLEPVYIHLRLSGDKSMTHYLAEQIEANTKKLGIKPEHVGVDTTGVQGMLVDVLERDYGMRGILRIPFGGAATDMIVSLEDTRKASEEYANRVTELWFNAYEFGRAGQLRGMADIKTCRQFCTRIVLSRDLRKTRIESKIEMKKRTGGISPDEADGVACVIAVVRQQLGIHPGFDSEMAKRASPSVEARKFDIDGSDENYLHSPFEQPEPSIYHGDYYGSEDIEFL